MNNPLPFVYACSNHQQLYCQVVLVQRQAVPPLAPVLALELLCPGVTQLLGSSYVQLMHIGMKQRQGCMLGLTWVSRAGCTGNHLNNT